MTPEQKLEQINEYIKRVSERFAKNPNDRRRVVSVPVSNQVTEGS
jgi:hypothetical protein